MGIKDILNASKIKEENERLQKLSTPEMQNAANMQNYIQTLQTQIDTMNNELSSKQQDLSAIQQQISILKNQIVEFEDTISIQEYGLYTPRYDFANSSQYKDRLDNVRQEQNYCVKDGDATTGLMSFSYNGSTKEGQKLVKDMQKLLLLAFNNECDETISKVKYNNYDASLKKITLCAEKISRLGKLMQISVSTAYYNLKVEELQLSLEFEQKKQAEKEELKQLRAEERERIKAEKEIETQRKTFEKEQSHYQNALTTLLKQLEDPANENNPDLLLKKDDLESKLGEIDASMKQLDYREANQRAGYVYVISNIGSFGENIYKIGMTRRLDPMDRIYELGDASVPFDFDVHAMIFTDDAPGLETALHKAFEDRKLNMVNQRREFFHVTLDDVKEVIKNNFDKTVEFIDVPDATQYRISLKLAGRNPN